MNAVESILTEYRQITADEKALRLEQAAAADKRAELIRMLKAAGMSYNAIARAVQLTPQRVGKLAKRNQ